MTPIQETKITYVTMTTDRMEAIHRELDRAIEQVQGQLGASHHHFIGGQPVSSSVQFDDVSPHDTRILLGRFPEASPDQVREAVRVAGTAAPAWASLPWQERVATVRRVADAIRRHRWGLAVLMGFEAGKNRLECVGDVEETADLIEYYCSQFEQHDGFAASMATLGPNEENASLLRPHGVWAVISPFNFPLALAGGPASAALVAGNAVVLKPASDAPFVGLKLSEMAIEAGVPPGVFNVITGGGSTVGQALADDPGVSGVVFTGSKQVGMGLIRTNASRPIPRPFIAEMGGKNPALVMASADLDKAAEGVMRSAFGAQGQKCSACSRVYIEHEVTERFVGLLAEKTASIRTETPWTEKCGTDL